MDCILWVSHSSHLSLIKYTAYYYYDLGLPPEIVDKIMGLRSFRDGPLPPSMEEIRRLLSLAGASCFLHSEVKKLTRAYHLFYQLGVGSLDFPLDEWRQHSISGDFVEALERTESLRGEIKAAEQRRCSILGVEVNPKVLSFLLETWAPWGRFTHLTHVEVIISVFDEPLAWDYIRYLPQVKTVTFNAVDTTAWDYLPELTQPFIGLSIKVGWILDALLSRRKFGNPSYGFDNTLVTQQGGTGPVSHLEIRHWGPCAQSIVNLIASCERTLTCLTLQFNRCGHLGTSCVFINQTITTEISQVLTPTCSKRLLKSIRSYSQISQV
jgi:hypothetical protein